MNTLLVKLQAEYHSILFSKDPSPEQKDRRLAIAVIIAEVQMGMLNGKGQTGTNKEVVRAAEAWLDKIDVIYDPLAKTIWSADDIIDAHRVRKHVVEILEGFKKTA